MRWLLVLTSVLASSAASAGPSQSNPAFLGIGFGPGPGGCIIENVSRGGAAWDAGLQVGDLVAAIDGNALNDKAPCDLLVTAITAHVPGDRVRIDVARGAVHLALTATLTTRADVLQKRVGQRMDPTEVTDADDTSRHYELGDRTHRTAVYGFFMSQCAGCARVFERVADGLKKRGNPAFVLGVTPTPLRDDVAAVRKSFTPAVPLALADADTFEALAMNDADRVFFMVTDCKGIVKVVAPVAPDSDDIEAAIDEVLAAAEQAEHARTQRR